MGGVNLKLDNFGFYGPELQDRLEREVIGYQSLTQRTENPYSLVQGLFSRFVRK